MATTRRRAAGVEGLPLASLSLNTGSPSRAQPAKGATTAPKSIFAPNAAAQTTRRKGSASPPKSRARTAAAGGGAGDDHTGNLTGTYDISSRRSSPVKQSGSGGNLAAGGGIGRSGVANHDRDPSILAGDSKRSPSKKSRNLDRYIPSRQTGNGDHTGPILLPTSSSAPEPTLQTAEDAQHTADLSRSLGINQEQRILSFFAEPPLPQTEHNSLMSQYARLPNKGSAASASSAASAASRRRIPTQPDRVLDAPGMLDDYYLNLLDWSTTNLLAIALAEVVYVWNAQTGTVTELCQVGNSDSSVLLEGDEYICSVKFTEDGSHLAVGLASGPIQVYDVTAGQLVRTMSGHPSRVPSLSWSGAILASGCRSGEIWNSDVRVAQHCVTQMRGHRGEVCGLEWRPEIAGGLSGGGQGLLASGGNDNVVNVWDGRMTNAPKMSKTNHTAAVKALAWCPWNSSLLASGGGSSDRTIHFWNTTQSARLNSLVTTSQVTSLAWNPHGKELLSTHGVPDHHIALWSYPSLGKIAEIPHAHQARILHSCVSPDGMTVATASSDEDLKFWKVFDMGKKAMSSGSSARMLTGKDIDENDGIGRKGKTGISVR
ncbi:WD40 repeat-like protein [Rhodotorula sp. JG-1b]|nr:WD40 repeat-like protein [Rhodotorula sp. JG-1b]